VKRLWNQSAPKFTRFAAVVAAIGAVMPKIRPTISLDQRVVRAVRVKAARTGRRDSDVIEDALRRDLGFDLLNRISERANLGEDEAMKLAVDEVHKARRES
jgi:hypothetical protein